MVCCSGGMLQWMYVAVLQWWCVAVVMCYSDGVLQWRYVAVLQWWCVAVVLCLSAEKTLI